jgi:hypothetical protein
MFVYIYTQPTYLRGVPRLQLYLYLISESVLKEVDTAAVDRLSAYQLGLKQPRQRYLQGLDIPCNI